MRVDGHDQLPERLGKYHVLGIAGRGNMGVVYTGYDPYADRDVAIKVSSVASSDAPWDTDVVRRLFFNEAHTAGILDHPNILKVLDAGNQDHLLYVVMEYVEGGETLARHCSADRLLPIPKVAEIIYTCAKALDYAHCREVVHRDIKPTNILFTRDGELKIGDFGVAMHPGNTCIEGAVGSPRYMSPEQLLEQRITRQTDLYSLGVVMYELLTGEPPFRARSLGELGRKICHEPPPPVRDLRPEIPEALALVLDWALQKDPSRRYRAGEEMASDLAAVYTELDRPPDPLTTEEKVAWLGRLAFFEDFSEAERREVLAAAAWRTYAPGQRIATDSTTDLAFVCVLDGAVTVRKDGDVVSRLEAGSCFGDAVYFGAVKHRGVHLIASEDAAVLQVNSHLIDQASTECQLRFHKAFGRYLVKRLSTSSAATASRRSPAAEAAAAAIAAAPGMEAAR